MQTLFELALEFFDFHELHPAWRAIVDLHPDVTHVQAWEPGAVKEEGGAWDWQIALSMVVRGYGADVTPVYASTLTHEYHLGYKSFRDSHALSNYELPPMLVEWYPREEESFEVAPTINPRDLIAYYERTVVSQVGVLNGSH